MFNTLQFLPVPPEDSLIYEASYSPLWVTVSVLIAILASYAALRASTRIAHSQTILLRFAWISVSSFVLGVGTWAMHFIGMLALSLPCGIHYDPFITLISMIPGILAAGVAFGVVWHHGKEHLPPALASILFGAGIGTMHYTGMAAMHLDGFIRYNPSLFVLSILSAILLAFVALRAKDRADALKKGLVPAALILGGAVSATHYVAMTATYFVRGNADNEKVIFTTSTLAVQVAITTVIMALAALTLAAFSRNREITEQLRESEERLSFALESAEDGVWDWAPQTDEAMFSRRWKEMIGYADHEFPNEGSAWIEHLHPDDKQDVLATMQNYFSGGTSLYTTEFRMRCKDGSWKWILARGKVISRDEHGTPLRMIGTHTDISERKFAEVALHESNQKLNTLLNSMAEGAYGVDTQDICTFVNQSFLTLLGFEHPDEVIGQHLHELIHHSHADGRPYPALECRMHKAYKLNQGIHVDEEVFWKKNGTSIPVEYWSQPIIVDGVMQGAIATFVDITERKQVMADLRESEERFRQMFERHSAVMLLIEPQSGMIVDANPAAAEFYGYPLQILRGKTIKSINTQSESEIALEQQAAVSHDQNHFVFDHRLENGEIRTVEVHSSPVSYKGLTLLFSIIHDITERKLAEAQIHNLAFYDSLTQLPNRRLLYDRLDQEISACKRSGLYGALMFMDLDNFKPLNDSYGHKIGDLLLIEVAQRITNCIRETDTAARFGGDEFVVMLDELDKDMIESEKQAGIVAEKIRAKLSEPYLLPIDNSNENFLEHHCSSSIGLVIFNYPVNRDELLKLADEAMYQAKYEGRNRVVVSRHIDLNDVTKQNTSILHLNWHESYECSEATIDKEHRQLFELANNLIESAFSRDENPRRFNINMEKLLSHVIQHFADEEAILAKYNYPALTAHEHAHKILIDHALQLKKSVAAGEVSVGELMNFLANEVIAQHMLKTDRQFYSLFKNDQT